MNGYTVSVVYRDRNLDKVGEAEYTLQDYVKKQSCQTMSLLVDIEELVYKMTGERDKGKWPKEYRDMFMKVRHKIFDIANGVSRIPTNMKCDGVYVNNIEAAKMIARIID